MSDPVAHRRRHPALMPALAALFGIAALASLGLGSVPLSPDRLFSVMVENGDPVATTILFQLRLPRLLVGLLVGAALGLAGAVLQGYLRNPLAEPGVLGASSAAAMGAVAALYFGFAEWHFAALPAFAIAGAILALVILFGLAGKSDSPLALILAGIAVGTLANAGISLALNLSPNPFAAMEIASWLLGSIENRSMAHVAIAAPCVLLGMALLFIDGRALDALTLGEDGARSLGIALGRVRIRLLLGVSIAVGGAVAVSGAIGFVGLVVPHILRPFTDRSPSAILLPSMLGGAVLLTFSDVLVRIIPSSNELKLGVVTALLGVPVFLAHLLRERRLW